MLKTSIKLPFLSFFILLTISFTQAQNGTIAGNIIDEKSAEPLIGATIMVQGSENVGAQADIDGHYKIEDVKPGTYTIVVTYVGYATKNIDEVVVAENKLTNLNITLSSGIELIGVVVSAKARDENINSVLIAQKNSISIVDGTSRDIIQRSPDKNTGEVLKRMSGTTLQDGKFAIIRGLSDRYNIALVNGNVLPSTEPDRKSFAFDLFPSNLLDNLFIYKTAQPDLPGDFAGGIIQLNTRDIPDENFFSLSIGTSVNTISTFKEYYSYEGGKNDWIGIDNGARAVPASFPDYHTFESATNAEKVEYSSLMQDKWGVTKNASAPLAQSYQLSGGFVKPFKGKSELGGILALTYNASNTYNQTERSDFGLDLSPEYNYVDDSYKYSVLWGGLANVSFKINDNNRLSFKNSYSVNAYDRTTIRNGDNYTIAREQYNEIYDFLSNRLLTDIISGDHFLTNSKLKIKWNVGINHIIRDQPDLRTFFQGKNFTPAFDGDTVFLTSFPYSASPDYNGKFYSYLTEKSVNGSIDISYPFAIKETPQTLKFGASVMDKDRQFDARVMGYVATFGFYSNPNVYSILAESSDKLFLPVNIGSDLIRLDETTNPSDSYSANVTNKAAYIMLDNKFGKNIRFVWGVRAEFFNQTLDSYFNSASGTPDPINIDTKETDTVGLPFDLLPSANLIFSLNEKTNLRFAASKTVTRPEIRELAPFSYYDYETSSSVTGNPNLLSTDIYNYDMRFEHFLGKGQVVSASLFYKDFINPIEKKIFIGGEYKVISPINEAIGRNFGAEMEVRKNLGFISTPSKFFESIVFNVNLAYIKSKVDVTDTAYVGAASKPLQGQSPYVVNVGLSYINPKNGLSFTVLYNEIGRRIDLLGYINYQDIYENSRPQLDAQVSMPFMKNGLIRITYADILAKDQVFYQDLNDSGKYEENDDNTIIRISRGSNISLSVSYKF